MVALNDGLKTAPPSSMEKPSHEGKAMTSWWLRLTAWVFVNTTVLFALFPTSSSSTSLPAIIFAVASTARGLCAASGLCVGLGYYTFSIHFSLNFPSAPPLCRQIYDSSAHSISYPAYFALDTVVHVGATAGTFLAWHSHLSPLSIALAFLFHRSWSYYHSRGATCYLRGAKGDEIYGFANLTPSVMWDVMYASESATLVVMLAMVLL